MAGESVLGELWIAIRAHTKDLDKDLKSAKSKSASVLSGLGKAAGGVAIAGLAALSAAVLGVGAAAYEAGMKFDGAYDTILIKTGATGTALEGLKTDFNEVFKSVPTDAAVASEALSVLHARTGLVGSGLQEMTKQMLELARITDGDAVTTSENYTRVLGDWSVATEDASDVADMFFVAGQKAGVGVDDLMTKVVQFGSPLRLMGFSLKQAISMFAKWEKEGVNSELVMGSLRIAAGKFADEGRPLQESLAKTIESIKNNEDATAALAEGMEVFGARAGPDMVAAIREGRFSIDEFAASLEGSEGAIMNAAEATMDFPEKLQLAKQKLDTYLAPIGLMFMDTALVLIDKLQPALDKLGPFIENTVAPAFERLAGAIVKVADGDLAGALEDLFGDPETLTAGIGDAVGEIGGTIGGMIVDAIRGIFGLDSSVSDTASDLETLLRKAANQVGKALPSIAGGVGRGFIESLFGETPRSAAAAEITLPTQPQPFGQGADLAVSTILGGLYKKLGLEGLANAEVNKSIGYIENLYKDANEQAQKGFITQIGESINKANAWSIAGSLNAITDPNLKKAVMDYMLTYSSEEVLPIVQEAIRTGVTGTAAAAFNTFGTTDGTAYGEAFGAGAIATARAAGVLPALTGSLDIESTAWELGVKNATSWQGGFNAQFSGWQPPQLNIDMTGNIRQAVPTPSMAQTYITVGNINITSPDPRGSGRSVIDELRKNGYQQ